MYEALPLIDMAAYVSPIEGSCYNAEPSYVTRYSRSFNMTSMGQYSKYQTLKTKTYNNYQLNLMQHSNSHSRRNKLKGNKFNNYQ